jgi:hypothetical protein
MIMKLNGKNIKCSYCGNDSFTTVTEKQTEYEPFGEIVEFEEKILRCKKCGDEINYTLNYTDEYEKAQKRSEQSSIVNILEYFSKKNVKLKDIEDSLGLPVRTLSRWKSRLNYSAIGLTLLRVIRSYPWIIFVAARRFEKKYVDEVFKEAAMKKFNLVERNKTVSPEISNASALSISASKADGYILQDQKYQMVREISSDYTTGV